MYIWESNSWPNFSFNSKSINTKLKKVVALQTQLIGQAKQLPEDIDREAEMDTLIQDALQTSQIEGEILNVGSVRSSVAKQLGLMQAGLPASTRQTESLVAMLCRATSNLQQPLSQKMLCEWQAALFQDPPMVKNIVVGDLRGEAPMQVVSKKGRCEIIHYESPPKSHLQQELNAYIDWFNLEPNAKNQLQMHGIIRAAIAHLWLITIHPFDDGNGRVTRALTDRILAQNEKTSIRFYSLSAAIEKNREGYSSILENTQGCKTKTQQRSGCDTDVTEWISWFLDVMIEAIEQGRQRIDRVINKTRFWKIHSQTVLSARQIKVLNRLLDSAGDDFKQGINAGKYKNLTKTSKATATRDLAVLVDKGCLKQLPGGGRSIRYVINI